MHGQTKMKFKIHTQDPQILGAILQNLVAWAILYPGFDHPCTRARVCAYYGVCGSWRNEYGALVEWFCQGKPRSTGRKSVTVPLCAPQISIWSWAVIIPRPVRWEAGHLTARAAAQPRMLCVVIWRYVVRLIGADISEWTADCTFLTLTVFWTCFKLPT